MLERLKTEVGEERSTRKEPLTDREARELLSRAERVVIARGKKTEEIDAAKAQLRDLKGPTGNYRAPMVLAAGTLLVGLSIETLESVVGD